MARRFGRQSAKRPIVSNKEIVDSVVFIVAGGVTTDIDVATSVNNYLGSVGTMPLGSTLLGFYLEISTNNVDNIVGRTDWFLCKRNGNEPAVNFPVPGASGGHPLRKYIFHEEKGIHQANTFDNGAANTAGGQSFRTKQFLAIPKSRRRMGEDDRWTIRVGSSENYSFCMKCIYKWYA